jgi:hypothetical protein
MGCLQSIIGSKFCRLPSHEFPLCVDNSSPCRKHDVIAMTWLLTVYWSDQKLTDTHGQRGKFLNFSLVSGLAASAFYATSQPTCPPMQAYLRGNPLLFAITRHSLFCHCHFFFFLTPVLTATLHYRERSTILCTSSASLITLQWRSTQPRSRPLARPHPRSQKQI